MKNNDEFRVTMGYRGLNVDLQFADEVCLVKCGKSNKESTVIKAIREYCKQYNIDCRYVCADMIDVKGKSVDAYGRVDETRLVKDVCTGGKVIILDNADLYVNGKEIDSVANENNIVIAVMQNPEFVRSRTHSCEYVIKYDEESRKLTAHRYD